MPAFSKLTAIVAAGLLALVLYGCEDEEVVDQSAVEIEDTIEETGETMGDAVEGAVNEAEEVGDTIERTVETAD